MTKTPDEIKRNIVTCMELNVEKFMPGATQKALSDALALIQSLEDRNNAMYHTILGVMHFVDKWLDSPAYDPDEDLKGTAAVARAAHAREIALQAIEQLEAERNAAVADMAEIVGCPCGVCKHYLKDGRKEPCNSCRNIRRGEESHFEWRGVQKEDGHV